MKIFFNGYSERNKAKKTEEELVRQHKNILIWGSEIPWGQRKTGEGGKVLLQRHLRCPDDR